MSPVATYNGYEVLGECSGEGENYDAEEVRDTDIIRNVSCGMG